MNDAISSAAPALIHRVAEWLMARSLKDADLQSIVRGCCERLHSAGLPIVRPLGFFNAAPALSEPWLHLVARQGVPD